MYGQLVELFPQIDTTAIEDTISHFGIVNDAAFIAQCAHESNRFKTFKENLNYSAQALMKTWPNRFDEALANECARNPERIANIVYANRMGNGDSESGDGWKYIGRGAIQITGFNNYKAIEKCFIRNGICNYEGEIVENSVLLESSPFAYYSAGAYWQNNKLDTISDYKTLTKKINGGLNGYEDRVELLNQVQSVL